MSINRMTRSQVLQADLEWAKEHGILQQYWALRHKGEPHQRGMREAFRASPAGKASAAQWRAKLEALGINIRFRKPRK